MSAMLRLSDTRARYVQSAAFGFESYFTVYYMKGWVDYVYRMFSCYNCLFSFFVTHHVFFACGGALLCTKREEKKRGVCERRRRGSVHSHWETATFPGRAALRHKPQASLFSLQAARGGLSSPSLSIICSTNGADIQFRGGLVLAHVPTVAQPPPAVLLTSSSHVYSSSHRLVIVLEHDLASGWQIFFVWRRWCCYWAGTKLQVKFTLMRL